MCETLGAHFSQLKIFNNVFFDPDFSCFSSVVGSGDVTSKGINPPLSILTRTVGVDWLSPWPLFIGQELMTSRFGRSDWLSSPTLSLLFGQRLCVMSRVCRSPVLTKEIASRVNFSLRWALLSVLKTVSTNSPLYFYKNLNI